MPKWDRCRRTKKKQNSKDLNYVDVGFTLLLKPDFDY